MLLVSELSNSWVFIQLIEVKHSGKMFKSWSVEMVQSAKCLPYQLQYLSSVPRNQVSTVVVLTGNMRAESGETGQSLGLAGQSVWTSW